MPDHQNGEQRAHFRLCYPPRARPVISIGEDDYDVLELSENGLRFEHGTGHRLAEGDPVQAVLCFRDETKQDIVGVVIRRSSDETTVRLTSGVAFSRVMQEQRYLLAKYPRVREGYRRCLTNDELVNINTT